MQAANNVGVADGLFTVSIDFGAAAFNGDARWMEIAVRSPAGGGTFTTLTPRQSLTTAPYALYALSGPGSGGAWALSGNNINNTNTGNVGIGDTTPAATLTVGNGDKFQVAGAQGDVAFTDDQASITFAASDASNSPMMNLFASGTSNGDRMVLAHSPGFPTWGLEYEDNGDRFNFLNNGNSTLTVDLGNQRVGIGNAAPGAKLHVNGNIICGQDGISSQNGSRQVGVASSGTFNDLFSYQAPLTINHVSPTNVYLCMGGGNVGIGTMAPGAKLDVAGTTRTSVLEITGADLAEKFPTSDKVEPGMVVAIDPQNAGKLCLARGAYNPRVAGVVSGANNFSAGAVLGNLPGHEDAPPVALSGRVYVWCDTSGSAIEPGDLLTTSDIAGHAMKATDDSRTHGAVLGKAMTALSKGERGLVLVLVSLQ
jgi:hypothetical protein